MEHYKSLFYSLAILLPAVALLGFISDSTRSPQTLPEQVGTSTVSVVDGLPPVVVPLLVPDSAPLAASSSTQRATATSSAPSVSTHATSVATTTKSSHAATTTTPVQKPLVPQITVPIVAPVVPVQLPLAITQDIVDAGLNSAAEALRGALVNIICYAPAGSGLHSMTGSGVIVDPKGIVLTNAHIAQYFLFADRGVSCHLRSGSPAVDRYTASLLYIPAAWIQNNAQVLTQASPSGTGEYDFAFIGITGSTQKSGASLPTAFPAIPLATSPLANGTPVVIGSYGAQFLAYTQIQSDLFPTLVYGSVKDVYTFATNSADVVALGGSAAAQEGSSGGGVATMSNELAATITTSTNEGETSARQLNAITASYIRREYRDETGDALDTLLSTPVATSISNFASKGLALEAVLAKYLP